MLVVKVLASLNERLGNEDLVERNQIILVIMVLGIKLRCRCLLLLLFFSLLLLLFQIDCLQASGLVNVDSILLQLCNDSLIEGDEFFGSLKFKVGLCCPAVSLDSIRIAPQLLVLVLAINHSHLAISMLLVLETLDVFYVEVFVYCDILFFGRYGHLGWSLHLLALLGLLLWLLLGCYSSGLLVRVGVNSHDKC